MPDWVDEKIIVDIVKIHAKNWLSTRGMRLERTRWSQLYKEIFGEPDFDANEVFMPVLMLSFHA